ncbi:hypothetical protein B1R32_11512 [Abditibacterium utsteinense]|uniref:Uncharacterized protein n=1 Tax=Abditibacterium utsteinense TaxID=1960156 RepID=A0A2S8SQP3_9BACT|nr:hypothetical protein B1R32_11512 [Abditibacterium utsteinense]
MRQLKVEFLPRFPRHKAQSRSHNKTAASLTYLSCLSPLNVSFFVEFHKK